LKKGYEHWVRNILFFEQKDQFFVLQVFWSAGTLAML